MIWNGVQLNHLNFWKRASLSFTCPCLGSKSSGLLGVDAGQSLTGIAGAGGEGVCVAPGSYGCGWGE